MRAHIQPNIFCNLSISAFIETGKAIVHVLSFVLIKPKLIKRTKSINKIIKTKLILIKSNQIDLSNNQTKSKIILRQTLPTVLPGVFALSRYSTIEPPGWFLRGWEHHLIELPWRSLLTDILLSHHGVHLW